MFSSDYISLYVKTYFFLAVGGCALYSCVATFQYLVWFKWNKDKYLKYLDMSKTKPFKEFYLSLWNLSVQALFTAAIKIELDRNSYLYIGIGTHGYTWFFFSIFLTLIVTEFFVYWVHRLEHDIPWLYSHTHYIHHEFVVVTPYCGWAFHPLDAFGQALPMLIVPFFFPIHQYVHLGLNTLLAIWGVLIHDNMSYWPNDWILYAAHHTIHHDKGRHKNYGQFTTFWDRVFGTYEHPPLAMPFQEPKVRVE